MVVPVIASADASALSTSSRLSSVITSVFRSVNSAASAGSSWSATPIGSEFPSVLNKASTACWGELIRLRYRCCCRGSRRNRPPPADQRHHHGDGGDDDRLAVLGGRRLRRLLSGPRLALAGRESLGSVVGPAASPAARWAAVPAASPGDRWVVGPAASPAARGLRCLLPALRTGGRSCPCCRPCGPVGGGPAASPATPGRPDSVGRLARTARPVHSSTLFPFGSILPRIRARTACTTPAAGRALASSSRRWCQHRAGAHTGRYGTPGLSSRELSTWRPRSDQLAVTDIHFPLPLVSLRLNHSI